MRITYIPAGALVLTVGPSGSGKSVQVEGWRRKCGLSYQAPGTEQEHDTSSAILSIDSIKAALAHEHPGVDVTNLAYTQVKQALRRRLSLGYTTVVDATNLLPQDRKALVAIAKECYAACVAVRFDVDEVTCGLRQMKRQFPKSPESVRKHISRMEQYGSVEHLISEGFDIVVTNGEQTIMFLPDTVHGEYLTGKVGLDFIGDIHGSVYTLLDIMGKLGYNNDPDSPEFGSHPQGRLLISVGDVNDKGVDSVGAMRLMLRLLITGRVLWLQGNHEKKLQRYLSRGDWAARKQRETLPKWGLAETLDTIYAQPDAEEFIPRLVKVLGRLLFHVLLDEGKVASSHAGLTPEYFGRTDEAAMRVALFGQADGIDKETGLPNRIDWAKDYDGETYIIHGHVVMKDGPRELNRVIAIDTGVNEGLGMAAFSWPEHKFLTVPTNLKDIR